MTLAKIKSDENFDYHKFVMQRLSNFLNSYAKAFNKQHSRMGALFLDYTKRAEIKDEANFTSIIKYIHQNPIHHGFCEFVSDWEYSSYNAILKETETFLEKEEIINWFGSLSNFIDFHRTNL